MSAEEAREIVERLRLESPFYTLKARTLRYAAADMIESLLSTQARVKELEERLECNHAFQMIDGKMQRVEVDPGDIPDGIDSRDETIRQQDKHIDALLAEICALKEGSHD